MQPALFTRNTLAFIRKQALMFTAPTIAMNLNWEVSRLERVARAHGIALRPGKDNGPKLEPSAPPLPRRQPQRVIAPELAEIIADMKPRQAEVMKILAGVEPDSFTKARVIANKMGRIMSEGCVIEAILRARRHLRRVNAPWIIEGRQRCGGGYRLTKIEPTGVTEGSMLKPATLSRDPNQTQHQ
jgi:hypothetical protein